LQLAGHTYSWTFLLADVSFPILGIDFLRKQQLVVDVVGSSLIPRACAVGWVDIGTRTKVPLKFITYLSKITKINEKSVLTH
jgi:hypothetical protein